MRPDQRARLAEVSMRLADVAITDADPDRWSAAGKTLADMTKEERGNAAWCRKTAIQSVALLVRVEQLMAEREGTPADDDATEAETRRAEKAAAELMDRVRGRSHAKL